MKFIFALTLFVFSITCSNAQVITSDTTPVWVVYLDSVRVFAAYPGVDMRQEVAAGWMVVSVVKDGFEFFEDQKYFDTNGTLFDNDMVLFAKKRKLKPSPFRQ